MRDIAENLDRYIVGGSVRDELLGVPIHDRDWVVVGSTESEMKALGFRRVGRDFPVFLHPATHDEYALARTERKEGRGYRGFAIDANPSVTLTEDLERRDLTINAIAKSIDGELIDPYGGRHDLEAGVLRHVSEAFSEDPLRVLRVARFAARFHGRGFSIADETINLMRTLAESGEVSELVTERVWAETSRALDEDHPSVYFESLRDCGALEVLLPEIDQLFGVPQPPEHHPEIDTGIHTMMALDAAANANAENRVRFAVLTHDLGKALTPANEWPSHHGHESRGVPLIENLCDRLRVPNDYRRLAVVVSEHHLNCHRIQTLRPKTILKILNQLGAFRENNMLAEFIQACECDARGRKSRENEPYPQGDFLRTAGLRATSVTAATVLAQKPDLKGAALGEAIRMARIDSIRQLES